MPSSQYDYRTFGGVVALASQITKILESNQSRVSLIVTFTPGSVGGEFYLATKSNSGTWARLGIPGTYVFPWRDYGPIIRAEQYIFNSAANTAYALTEIVRLATPPA
jgi:hypothetical protein